MANRMQTDLTIGIAGAEAVYACTVVYTYSKGYPQTLEEPGEDAGCEISSVTGRMVERKFDLAKMKYITSVPANAVEVDFMALLSSDALDELSAACLTDYTDADAYARDQAADMRREEMRVA